MLSIFKRKPAIDISDDNVAGFFGRVWPIPQSRRLYPYQPYVTKGHHLSEGPYEGICPVCGSEAKFSGFSDNLRESGSCSNCGSSNRQRQLALMVRRRMLMAPAGPLSLPGKVIYNTESSGAVHKELAKNADYVCSEYFGDDYVSGQEVNGTQHQDLCSLSFADDSFDLILSSDVLEHMPSPYDAHREIFRVLKPGGRHLFTVPFIESQVEDQVRARVVDGQIEYLREKIFHGDPVRPGEGVLVWVVFGIGMMKKLEAIGFKASCWSLYEPDHGIIGNHQLVFEAHKPIL